MSAQRLSGILVARATGEVRVLATTLPGGNENTPRRYPDCAVAPLATHSKLEPCPEVSNRSREHKYGKVPNTPSFPPEHASAPRVIARVHIGPAPTRR